MIWFLAKLDQSRGDAGDSRDAFRVRRIERAIMSGLPFFEGDRHGNDAAVKLRNGDIDCCFQRIQSARGKLPGSLRNARRHGLNHRNVQLFERAHIRAGRCNSSRVDFALREGERRNDHARRRGEIAEGRRNSVALIFQARSEDAERFQPRADSASASASMNPVLPLKRCAR